MSELVIFPRLDRTSLGAALRAYRCAREAGLEARVEDNAAVKIESIFGVRVDRYVPGFDTPDWLMCIGGDGTILRALVTVEDTVNVIGVKSGRVSRLSYFSINEVCETIKAVNQSRLRLQQATRIRLVRGDEPVTPPALNEIVVKAAGDKIMRVYVSVRCGDETLEGYIIGDGVLVATPMGSTAYNLSADGPVLPRVSELVVVTGLNVMEATIPKHIVADLNECSVSLRVEAIHRNPKLVVDGQWSTTIESRVDLSVVKASHVNVAVGWKNK